MQEKQEEQLESQIIPIPPTARFRFGCSPDVPCFNECCRELDQFLTPYDVLRLKNHLNLSSSDFISEYTTQHVGPGTGLPVVSLRMEAKDDFKCPFVTPEGCGVYEDRPASCRTYPLARIASRCRETGRINEQYAIIREPHCQGFESEKAQSVQEWVSEQDIAVYNEMNDLFMEFISLKRQKHPDQLDIRERHIFHLGCYDLDSFREQIFEKDLAENPDLDEKLRAEAKTDDTALLKLAMQWVKQSLFE